MSVLKDLMDRKQSLYAESGKQCPPNMLGDHRC